MSSINKPGGIMTMSRQVTLLRVFVASPEDRSIRSQYFYLK